MIPLSENDPIHHTQKIKAQMNRLIEHLRGDVGKVTEPKAQALFETSAEVLTGLVKAFDDYEKKARRHGELSPRRPGRKKERRMPQGDKSSYTDKQKRQAEHIEAGYEKKGLSVKTSEARAWATVNKLDGGGKKSGSGRKRTN
jgi:hypothetical protein